MEVVGLEAVAYKFKIFIVIVGLVRDSAVGSTVHRKYLFCVFRVGWRGKILAQIAYKHFAIVILEEDTLIFNSFVEYMVVLIRFLAMFRHFGRHI
jgi:hypothetical protein